MQRSLSGLFAALAAGRGTRSRKLLVDDVNVTVQDTLQTLSQGKQYKRNFVRALKYGDVPRRVDYEYPASSI